MSRHRVNQGKALRSLVRYHGAEWCKVRRMLNRLVQTGNRHADEQLERHDPCKFC